MSKTFALVPPEETKIFDDNETYRVDASQYKEFMKEKLKSLIFRRVKTVEKQNYVRSEYVTHNDTTVFIDDGSQTFTEEEYEKNIREIYDSFSFSTTTSNLRRNDEFKGVSIIGFSKNYAEIDIFSWEFKRKVQNVPPKNGDLVCGIIDTTKKRPEYFCWFICSEQFYRMWTILMYGTTDFQFKNEEEKKKKLMSGNRLCCASYKKFLLRCAASDIIPTEEEKKSRFQICRTEQVSSRCVHFYAVIVLMLYYGEFPNQNNIPKNLDLYPPKNMDFWDLPRDWLKSTIPKTRITQKIKIEPIQRKVKTTKICTREIIQDRVKYEQEFPVLGKK